MYAYVILISNAEKQGVMREYEQSGKREMSAMIFPWYSSSHDTALHLW